MDYEKKYKEALEWARKVMQGKVGFVLDDVLEKFPELAESEDEKIRNEIITFLTYYHTGQGNSVEYNDDWIAWLEKQGKNNMGISEATKKKLEDNLNKALEKETPESFNEFLDEQNTAWSEEDEDILNTIINHFKIDIECTDEDDVVRWLKSLRLQWKPNEEMLEALYRAIPKNVMEISEDEMLLDKLYQGLKYGRVLSNK